MLATEKRAGSERSESADRGPGQCEDGKAVTEVAAQVVDREETERQDAAFVGCREDSADGACDGSDNDVGGAHKHPDSFVER